MATLKLYLDKRARRKDGTFPVRLAVNNRRQTALVSVGVYINAEQWDAVKCRIVNHPSKAVLNTILQQTLTSYQIALASVGGYARNVTATELRERLTAIVNPQETPSVTFKMIFDKFIAAHENERTRQIYTATWIKISKFDNNAESLTFEEIGRDWLERFFVWLANGSPSVNARNIHLRNIRAIFNEAIDDGITTAYPFRRMKIRPVETAKRNLTPDQLRNIFNVSVETWMQKYVDIFKLSFLLLGINVGDLLSLPPDCIRNGRLEYNRKKTHRFYSINVEPEAMAIIERYPSRRFLLSFAGNCKSYRTVAAKTNAALQRLWPGVTTYYARHSVATIMAALDIPKETIAQALGHAATSVTDVYIDFDRRKIDAANRKLIDWVLYGKK